jgi:hypothetical protein
MYVECQVIHLGFRKVLPFDLSQESNRFDDFERSKALPEFLAVVRIAGHQIQQVPVSSHNETGSDLDRQVYVRLVTFIAGVRESLRNAGHESRECL